MENKKSSIFNKIIWSLLIIQCLYLIFENLSRDPELSTVWTAYISLPFYIFFLVEEFRSGWLKENLNKLSILIWFKNNFGLFIFLIIIIIAIIILFSLPALVWEIALGILLGYILLSFLS